VWKDALTHARNLYRILPHEFLKGSSPERTLIGTQPSLRNLHPFGCLVHVTVPEKKRETRLHPTTRRCAFLGYQSPHMAYIIDCETGDTTREHTITMKFFDDKFPGIKDEDQLLPTMLEDYLPNLERPRFLLNEDELERNRQRGRGAADHAHEVGDNVSLFPKR
jgi:hypothetical protein